MIVLNVTYTCKPGTREPMLEKIVSEGVDAAARAEEGNFKYDYYRSIDREDEILLIEKWRDDEVLAKHGEQPHFKRVIEIKEEFGADTVIEMFRTED